MQRLVLCMGLALLAASCCPQPPSRRPTAGTTSVEPPIARTDPAQSCLVFEAEGFG